MINFGGLKINSKHGFAQTSFLANQDAKSIMCTIDDMKKHSLENKTEAAEIKADAISAVALNTGIDATNKLSSNKRAVAITTEIALKRTRKWGHSKISQWGHFSL